MDDLDRRAHNAEIEHYRVQLNGLVAERDQMRSALLDILVVESLDSAHLLANGALESVTSELDEAVAVADERDRLQERLEAERRHRIAAVDREVETAAERDRLRAANNKRAGILLHVMSVLGDAAIRTEEGLPDAVAELLVERDRLRATAIDALGYGADYLVAFLCTSPSVNVRFAREFADRIEEMAGEVTGSTEYETGTLSRVGDALRDARETLDALDGSGDMGGEEYSR